jgi:glycosyltransferase involved in cell wall biosynthesis
LDQLTPLKKLKALNFPHLICVGRLIKSKRFDLAIEAVSSLKDEYPNILLTITGEGPCENNMKKKVEDLRLINHVRFLGHIKDMKGVYEMADIFILPSETEGSPISLIEAMAFSLPIIVTPVGAIPEMVEKGKSAMMIDPNDLTGLIESIRYLTCHQEECKALGKAAREIFLTKYISSIMASIHATHYQAVLQNLRDSYGVQGE